MLAAGLEGIVNQYPLPPSAEANVLDMNDAQRTAMGIESLPLSLGEAIEESEKSTLVRNALGSHVFDSFIRNKKIEWDRYRTQVSDYEIKEYLPRL